MGDLTPSSAGSVPGLALEAVEWLPSGAESGLIRVRGRWAEGAAAQAELPALVLRAEGREHRFDSLPDARFGRDPASWRGSYLVPADLVGRDPEALWIEWPGGVKAGLPPLARGLEPPPVDAPERPRVPEGDEAAGGQVIDRAVLAERRARRAEAAEQASARVAAEAVKAVEVLELRSSELERRLEEATAERDALAARVGGEGQQTERERRALAAALESAARLRAQLGDWRLRLRTNEVAHATDAVRLAVLESRAAAEGAGARAALHARTQELEEERRLGESRAAELAATRADAAAAQEELTRARAAAADELASARAAWEQRRSELERALDDVRAALTRAREEADARVAEVEAAAREHQARGTELERRLTEEHEARATAERSAATAEATAADLRARLTAAESAASEAGSRMAAAEAAATTAETRLRVESVARAALEDELDRERAARAAHAAAVEPLRDDLAAARAELERAQADLDAERTARLAAEAAVEPLRADLEAASAELERARGDLDAARGDLAAARQEIEGLARSLVEERAARAAAEASAERTGATLQDRIAELERAAAGAPPAERLERLARQQAEAAARTAGSPAPDLAARLDAAAEALRQREEGVAAEGTGRVDEAGRSDEGPGLAAARPPAPAVRRAAAPPARPVARPGLPVLRSALVRLAQDDPDAARRLLVALLPAQAAVVAGPLAYDLTIRDFGTYAISVVDGHAQAEAVGRPRSRRSAEFHLTADVLTLVELLSGVEHRAGRFFGPARIRGSKRRLAGLDPLRRTPPSLADVMRAGARIEPDLAWRTLGYAVHPSWTRGLRFTVAQVITGPDPRAWYLTARDGAGLAVTGVAPGGEPDAVVKMSPSAFERLLREEPYEPGDRPAVRGDREAVAQLLALAQRARRGG